MTAFVPPKLKGRPRCNPQGSSSSRNKTVVNPYEMVRNFPIYSIIWEELKARDWAVKRALETPI